MQDPMLLCTGVQGKEGDRQHHQTQNAQRQNPCCSWQQRLITLSPTNGWGIVFSGSSSSDLIHFLCRVAIIVPAGVGQAKGIHVPAINQLRHARWMPSGLLLHFL
jgi:hypothetical protein